MATTKKTTPDKTEKNSAAKKKSPLKAAAPIKKTATAASSKTTAPTAAAKTKSIKEEPKTTAKAKTPAATASKTSTKKETPKTAKEKTPTIAPPKVSISKKEIKPTPVVVKPAAKPEPTEKPSAAKRKPPVKPRITKPKKAAAVKKAEALIEGIPSVIEVESAKFEMAPPEKVIAQAAPVFKPSRELPESYGQTKIVLLVRDPEWVFCYWEINDEVRNRHNMPKAKHDKTLVLRVYDVTDIEFTGENAHRSYDVIVNDYASSWYLRIPEVNRSWCAELGYYNQNGKFVALVRSNAVMTPAGRISPRADEEWMQISQENLEEILRLSGGVYLFAAGASEDVVGTNAERVRMQIEQAGGASFGLASGQMSQRPAIEKDFWLVVNTDLIVYGATEPDARVTIQGKAVPLRSDGTFSVRFTLPDGTLVIPVHALNADGDRRCEIVPKVKKDTQ